MSFFLFFVFFCLMIRRPPRSTRTDTLFPYTTLFRSLASLGRFWTTRVIILPGAPLVRRGPYRWFRHPNYLVVTGEILVLPLAFGARPIAVVFSLANAAILALSVRVAERALAPRSEEHTSELQSLMRTPSAVFCLNKTQN